MADSTEQVTTTETPVTPTEPATEPSTLTAEAVSQMIAEAFAAVRSKETIRNDRPAASRNGAGFLQAAAPCPAKAGGSGTNAENRTGNAIRKRHSFAGFSSSVCGCRGRKDHQNTGGSLCNAVYRSGRKRRQGTPQRRTTQDRNIRTHDERTNFRHSR